MPPKQRYMISALQEHARKPPMPVDAPTVEMTCNYLEACHLIFEKGTLSHMTISPKYQRVLENIKEGFCFFKDWSTCHQNTGKSTTRINNFGCRILFSAMWVCNSKKKISIIQPYEVLPGTGVWESLRLKTEIFKWIWGKGQGVLKKNPCNAQ